MPVLHKQIALLNRFIGRTIVAQQLLANKEEPVSPDSQKKVIIACAKLDLRANTVITVRNKSYDIILFPG